MSRFSCSKNKSANQDGRKTHYDFDYYKIGRVRMNSWASEKIPVADIMVSDRELVHIFNRHKTELQTLGISSFSYVQMIVSRFSEVRKDTVGVYYFIMKGKRQMASDTEHVAVVELELKEKGNKKFYKIKTARPMNYGRLLKFDFVCDNPRS